MRDHLIDVKVGEIEDDPFESEVGNGNGEVVSCNLIQSSSLVNSIFCDWMMSFARRDVP